MKKIETSNDMVMWAKSVNLQDLRKVSDLQDVFARSPMADLKQFFMDLSQNDKELVVFSISKCMGSSALMEFIRVYAGHKAQIYLFKAGHELDTREAEIFKRERALESEKIQLQTTLDNLRQQNSDLVADNTKLTEQVSDYYKQNYKLQTEIDDMQTEMTRLYQFENHIKGLLKAA